MWIVVLVVAALSALEITSLLTAASFFRPWGVVVEIVVSVLLGLAVVWYWRSHYYQSVEARVPLDPQETLEHQLWEINGLLILLAGVLLMIPGVGTDVLGLLLLLPAVRRFVVRKISGTPGS